MLDIKLSIIIPHYNSGDLLEKLLHTIPNIPDVQVIVVDDHSTKKIKELEVCKQKYNNTNVEFYVNEFNKSAGGARNTGLKYAKGQWLLFADADDYFMPDFYDITKKYFETNYDLIYFIPTSIDLSTHEISDRHLYNKMVIENYLRRPSNRNCLQVKYMLVSPWSKLIRSDLVHKNHIKFDETLVANDVMASMKISLHSKHIMATDEIIYCITKQPGTLTTEVSPERYDDRTEVFYRRHQYLKDNLPKEDYKLLLFGVRYRLRYIIQAKWGLRMYFRVLKEMIQHRVPILREFSPLYYYDVFIDLARKYKIIK